MRRKHRIGCLAALCFWIACAAALLLSGQGIFNGLGDCMTIRGPNRSKSDLFVGHALDALTAPVQVVVLWPISWIRDRSINGDGNDKVGETASSQER